MVIMFESFDAIESSKICFLIRDLYHFRIMAVANNEFRLADFVKLN